MRHRGIDGDDKIERRNRPRTVREIPEAGSEIHDRRRLKSLAVRIGQLGLQTKKCRILDREYRFEISHIAGAVPAPIVGQAPAPYQPDRQAVAAGASASTSGIAPGTAR